MAELGKTARHYRKNKASRAKHVRDNSPGGKYAHSNEYKRAHSKARASLKIKSKNVDASKQPDGSFKAESVRLTEAEAVLRGGNYG